jgi:type I restriction enzyme S subunit
VANVQRGFLNLTEVKTIAATEAEIRDLQLVPGDVLFNEGGDRDKLGRGWIWEGQISECIHQNHVFRARIKGEAIEPKLLSWYANTAGQEYFQNEGKQTTNLASINMTKLAAFPVPVPPPAEQKRIVPEVERRLSLLDAMGSSVEHGLQRAERLRQSILKRAFEGRLVPQDPNDEPASALLERIHNERAATTTPARRGRAPRLTPQLPLSPVSAMAEAAGA